METGRFKKTKAMRYDVIYVGVQRSCNFDLKWDVRKIFCVLKRAHILSCDTFFFFFFPAVISFAHLVFSKGEVFVLRERDGVMQSAFVDELCFFFCFFLPQTCCESPSINPCNGLSIWSKLMHLTCKFFFCFFFLIYFFLIFLVINLPGYKLHNPFGGLKKEET